MLNLTPIPLVIARRLKHFALLLLLALGLTACQSHGRGGDAAAAPATLYQVSLIDALLAGDYDGQVTVGELKQHGNFGIGTFDELDGEMIVLDGRVYRAAADGSVRVVADSETTPFAVVAPFKPDQLQRLAPTDSLEALHAQLDAGLSHLNTFYAIKLRGQATYLKLRSVPAQDKPYQPLAEVVKHQSEWEYHDVAGTFVGLRCPVFARGMNVPGYHWHFISHDRRIAGHVLEARLPQIDAAIATLNAWHVALPGDDRHGQLDLGQDRSEALEHVEK